MMYTISFFAGIVVLLLLFLFLNKRVNLSLPLKLQSLVASVGIALITILMYLLFPIGLTIVISVVLTLLASLILAARLEREQANSSFQWELPAIKTAFDQVAMTTDESVQTEQVFDTVEVDVEPVLERKQPLTEVAVDESEELMTGRRRRIQDKEE
ncbi:hypothetical protein [Alkalicoccobacillus plakortidis]|uniref:YesK-like protein n=1 Tax=Alkalicoccobacillus plakortidis TaxID=444060 RepID=A0ABT0XGY1_9BACI|nr:hypothetical protein [Alkalicoccobacillus plakortidis]MCM2675183.1 hypothetical protein [Alkalicoccobacillus plakortidis]